MRLIAVVIVLILSSHTYLWSQDRFFESPDNIAPNNAVDNNEKTSFNFNVGLTDTLHGLVDEEVIRLDSMKSPVIHKIESLTDSIRHPLSGVADSLNSLGIGQTMPGEITSQALPDALMPDEIMPSKSAKPSGFPESIGKPLDSNITNQPLPDGKAIDELADKNASKLKPLEELQNQDNIFKNDLGNSGTPGNDMSNALPAEVGNSESFGNIDGLADQWKENNMADNLEAMQKMNELFSQHADKLEAAQSQMTKLKKKYSYVPNSNDLSTAVKINSLKGEPLKKRLIIGGNFHLERGNPLVLDIAPLVMYKFNKAFHAGISGSYRATVDYDKSATPQHGTATASTAPRDVFGASALARYFVVKGFFAYGEVEYRSSPYHYDGLQWSLSQRQWVPGALLGIGKQMALKGKLKGTVALTYDFLHSKSSFNQSPWAVKVGVVWD